MLISSTNLQVRISQDAHAHPSRRLLFRTASEAGEEIFSICQQSSVWQSSEMGSFGQIHKGKYNTSQVGKGFPLKFSF